MKSISIEKIVQVAMRKAMMQAVNELIKEKLENGQAIFSSLDIGEKMSSVIMGLNGGLSSVGVDIDCFESLKHIYEPHGWIVELVSNEVTEMEGEGSVRSNSVFRFTGRD
jgi:hypothetical protein